MTALMPGLPLQQDFVFGPNGLVLNHNPQAGEPLAFTPPASPAFAIAATYAGLKPVRATLTIMTEHSAAAVLMERLKANPGSGHFQRMLRVYLDRGSAVKTE